jgi:3-oxoacyl-[acyl-carrier-protein] synthase II
MRIPFPAVGITGLGCVSPLGLGLAATEQSLRASREGIGPVRLFSVEGCQSRTAGQVEESLTDQAVAIVPRSRRWTRAAQMLLVAAREALEARPGFAPDCVVVGTTSGGMTLGEEFYRAALTNTRMAAAARRMLGYPPPQPVHQVLNALGIPAPVRIVSNACASGTNAIGLACQMIRSGAARRVLAGGYDALAELVFAGFDCLRASTPGRCRPFDADRDGLVLGEGAALFCLEKKDAEVRVTGYGSTADTHHLTQPHPSGSGPLRAMRGALESAGILPGAVDYINAHGTGTPLNDASEARAILAICPDSPVSSTKGLTGHALGAAGAIEAAFCHIALRGEFLPANVNFSRPEDDLPLRIVANESRPARLRHVLSNSFGFGGANATILLSRS